jgi:phosphoribosyl-ATP pyrophosphohydrolase
MQIKKRERKSGSKNLRSATGKFGKGKTLMGYVLTEKAKRLMGYEEDEIAEKAQEEMEEVVVQPFGQDEFDQDNGYVEEKIDIDFRVLVRLELSKAHRFKRELAKFVESWR